MKAKMNKKNILIYILISFTFSWLIALIIYLFKLYKTGGTPSTLATVLLVVYMFGPAIAAAIVQKIQGKKIKDLGINFKLNSWWVIGWLTPVFIIILTVIISAIMGGGLYLYANTIRNDILYNLTGVSGIISIFITAAIILLLNKKPTSQISNQNH